MASNYWMKLYYRIIDDVKVYRLSDRQFRRMIELFLVAGEEDDDGYLPEPIDISFRLWKKDNSANLEKDMELLKEKDILEKPNGRWRVKNWSKWQAAASQSERKRRSRGARPFSDSK